MASLHACPRSAARSARTFGGAAGAVIGRTLGQLGGGLIDDALFGTTTLPHPSRDRGSTISR